MCWRGRGGEVDKSKPAWESVPTVGEAEQCGFKVEAAWFRGKEVEVGGLCPTDLNPNWS